MTLSRSTIFLLLILSHPATAALSGPTTDDDGNYTISWTGNCSDQDQYYLYENGEQVYSGCGTWNYSATNKPDGTYLYQLDHCAFYYPEPGWFCALADTGSYESEHTVEVTSSGGGGGGGSGGGGDPAFEGCGFLSVAPNPAAGIAAYRPHPTLGGSYKQVVSASLPTQLAYAGKPDGSLCPVLGLSVVSSYPLVLSPSFQGLAGATTQNVLVTFDAFGTGCYLPFPPYEQSCQVTGVASYVTSDGSSDPVVAFGLHTLILFPI